VILDQNILETTKGVAAADVWERTRKDFAEGRKGNMTFASRDGQETLCYVPVPDTGWEMAVLIRDSVIQDQIRDISEKNLTASRNQIIFAIVVVLLLAVILLWELRRMAAQRLEKEKAASQAFQEMANRDSMTGLWNRHAYYEWEAAINQELADGKLHKLAVVVCDINGLKYVNDTMGHAAGDRLIKDAGAMICGHFTHGDVYRVGGDEFVVLLQGEGYDEMTDVIRELNRRAEANIREGAVVIAAGYAVLEQGDGRLHDVFDRADQMMYERKKELKAMGARTR
jgi:diguanylate cyclase (GGDEF)-like protein